MLASCYGFILITATLYILIKMQREEKKKVVVTGNSLQIAWDPSHMVP